MKRFLTIIALMSVVAVVMAQQLVGKAPAQVAVGEQFRLTYTVNTQDVSGFRAGKIPDELEVLMGPDTSSKSNLQMVNGHTLSTPIITYTYVVAAKKNGTFTIPPAHITVGDKTIESNEVHIKVSGQAQQGSQQGGRQQQGTQPQMRTAGSAISASDVFIRVSANKHRVYEQEPIFLTYKLYTIIDLPLWSFKAKTPDLKSDFYWVPLSQQERRDVEFVDGNEYRTFVWKMVTYPQAAGKLEIPSITYDSVVVQQKRAIDPFEAFFNGSSEYVEIQTKIKAPGLAIQVDALPQRPAGFSEGVGTFTLSANLDTTEVKENDSVKLSIVVSGVGNLKFIKQPTVNLPKDFDQYDAKITDSTKVTTNGLEGYMVYDILIVPRHQGTFEIPPVEFIYYDTRTNSYKTLKSEPFTLNVAKGSGSELAQSSSVSLVVLGFLVVLALIILSLFLVFRSRSAQSKKEPQERKQEAS